MASSMALKRLFSSNILPSSLHMVRPMAVAPSTSRLFNTNAMREFDEDGDKRDLSDDRRDARSLSLPGYDVFYFLFPTRRVVKMMDQFKENPLLSEIEETEDALNLWIDMPGLEKEDVKVAVVQNTLIIQGESAKQYEEEETSGRYTSRIHLLGKIYKTDQIKAEMKNSVLKLENIFFRSACERSS